ncbi:Chain length determinant protein [Planctomycetes bacterium Poly30]|uniref:Chain length determinant protein n=1 Tax=Saltatorellus ferox TaxID=2528018 RepID=A0A518EQG9_9BACT|nr:Chain length determinant protein [Planctomycetes bacterium Poly30]
MASGTPYKKSNVDDFAHAQLDLDEAKNPFDLKVLVLYAVARFRGLILALGILGAILGLFAGAAQPNVYSSLTKLHFEPSVRQLIREEQAWGVETGEVRINANTAILEELELLKDPSILEAVVDKIGAREILRVADPSSADGPGTSMPVRLMHSLQAGLIRLKGLDDPFPEGPESEAKVAAYDRLKANVMIANQRSTQIIDVKYSDSSPAKAKQILDEIITQMRARHLTAFSARGSLDIVRENQNLAFQELSKAKNDLNEFKAQCGFHDLENEWAQCNEEILMRERELSDMHAERGALLGKVKSLSKDLGIGVSAEDEVVADGVNAQGEEVRGGRVLNPAYTRLRRQLEDAQGDLRDLQNLNSDPTPGSLPWRAQGKLTNLIAQLENDLQGTDPYGKVDGILGDGLDDSRSETLTLLSVARGELEGLINKIETTEERIAELEERRLAMEECEVEYNQSLQAAEMIKLKVDTLAAQERQLTGLAYMDDDRRSELKVFLPARLAKDKEGPQRSKPLLIGLIGGMVLGIGIAILRQLLERNVRYQETVENSLGLRVLCVVPDLSSNPGFGRKGASGKPAAKDPSTKGAA